MPFSRLKLFTAGPIRSERDLRRYITRTIALCVAAALAFDIVNQLTFFDTWTATLRSWALTVFVVLVIATPVARAIGKANLALFRAGQTDPLTGLLNRRALLEGIDDPAALMVLMIADINRFKAVNDTYGHLAGDTVLCAVAAMLERDLGPFGRVGRLGGEEFALVCGGRDSAPIMERLERCRETIARTPVLCGGAAVSVTVSAGVAHRLPGESFEQLYAAADQALYRAKAAGRNRVVVAGVAEAEATAAAA